MNSFDYVIVGAGFAGSTCAERLASAGYRVLIIDQRPHIAGNAYDHVNDDGVLVHLHGAHIFHTNSRAVFDYLSQFTEWRRYEHRVLSSVGGRLVTFPINRTTLRAFGGDEAAARAALIEPYTRKQWGPHADALDASVLARVKSRASDDDRYFQDTFQAMPLDGYTALVSRMLQHSSITVQLETSWQTLQQDAPDVVAGARGVIYTGPLDQFFDYRLGRLPYRSARFVQLTMRGKVCVQPAPVVNYPDPAVPYTRVAEFTQITGQHHPHTTVAYEYPMAEGEPFWPVPTAASAALAAEYRALAATLPTVHFCGRLGTFRYLNLDQAVAQALALCQRLVATACTQEPV